jgi:hypothetical protein
LASTDRDANASVAELRSTIVDFLLRQGADPSRREKHPMGVKAVIRAAVLDHFGLLQVFGKNMSAAALAAAMNEKPAVNGQTALHDSVHRALTAPPDVLPRMLEQISWMVARGANTAVEDHAGKTPATMARAGLNDPRTRANAASILKALNLS